jgi:peptide/nickel transport system permease protein
VIGAVARAVGWTGAGQDKSAGRARSRRSFTQRLLAGTDTRLAVLLTVLIVGGVLLAPIIAPYPNDAVGAAHMDRRLIPPGGEFLFGTDSLGRDVFSRVLFGGQTSLFMGVMSTLLAAVVGTIAALISGYWSGWIDQTIMRLADIFLGVPPLVLAVLVALTLGGGDNMTVIAIAATAWPRFARLVRGEVLRTRVLEFVDAARACGATSPLILRRHIFPATLPVLVAQSTLFVGQAILVAATLGFVGLGARPPSPEWGLSIAIGREYMPESWWISLFPGLMVLVTVMALSWLGEGLRKALDVRSSEGLA